MTWEALSVGHRASMHLKNPNALILVGRTYTWCVCGVQNGLEVRFLASGGHPVLLAQRNGFPTLLHNDFLFRCLVQLPSACAARAGVWLRWLGVGCPQLVTPSAAYVTFA